MGSAKRKSTKFFNQHPLCCFCGGGSLATTIDHVPNRAFFIKRDWPLGYEFPACAKCQKSTRTSELACAAIARSWPTADHADAREVVALYHGLAANDAAAFREFVGPERLTSLQLPTAVQFRLQTADGDPVMNLGPLMHAHLDDYIGKIVKALYYKHFAKIIVPTAAVVFTLASNADIGTERERRINSMHFTGVPTLVRCSNSRSGRPLSEQFEYTYLHDGLTGDSVFKIRLHQSFIIAAAVFWEGLPEDHL
jgi:hypothetical protein